MRKGIEPLVIGELNRILISLWIIHSEKSGSGAHSGRLSPICQQTSEAGFTESNGFEMVTFRHRDGSKTTNPHALAAGGQTTFLDERRLS